MTDTQLTHYSEWRRIANLRQQIINKLDRKVRRLENRVVTLEVSLADASARLAMYDARETAA